MLPRLCLLLLLCCSILPAAPAPEPATQPGVRPFTYLRFLNYGLSSYDGIGFEGWSATLDHYDGKKTMYHCQLGSFPKYSPYSHLVPGPGLSAGFTWGLLLSASHPSPQSLLLTLDLGIYGSMMRFDKTITDYSTTRYKGFFRYLEAHAGPRVDLLLPFSRTKALPFDFLISFYMHLNIAVMHFEETVDSLYFRDRSPTGAGVTWGLRLSLLCFSLDLEAGWTCRPALRLNLGIGTRL